MSIVHITLLKEVLDRGPDMPYYKVSLGLIITAIILQVIVGIIALLIANVRKYYDKYRDDPLGDVCENIFHCKCKNRESVLREKRIRAVVQQKSLVDLSHWDMMPVDERTKTKQLDLSDFAEDDAGCCSKLPCFCSREVHPAYEYDILDRYDLFCELMVKGEVAVVRPQQELLSLQRSISRAKTDISLYEAQLNDPGEDKQDVKDKLQAVEQRLEEYRQRGKGLDKHIQDEKVVQKQGRILYKYADAIRKNRVLKMISFWQHCINYTLYVVFLINAFIAGFGMTTPGADGAPLPGQNTADQNNAAVQSS